DEVASAGESSGNQFTPVFCRVEHFAVARPGNLFAENVEIHDFASSCFRPLDNQVLENLKISARDSFPCSKNRHPAPGPKAYLACVSPQQRTISRNVFSLAFCAAGMSSSIRRDEFRAGRRQEARVQRAQKAATAEHAQPDREESANAFVD